MKEYRVKSLEKYYLGTQIDIKENVNFFPHNIHQFKFHTHLGTKYKQQHHFKNPVENINF